MDLKGEITATELAEIFQMITKTRKEGTLTVANQGRKKAIYFSKQGVTLLFDSEKKSGSLGQMLLDHGKITPDQLEQALVVQKESGHRLGEILAGMGVVTQEEIEDLVRKQIEEEVFDLLSWRGGRFEFNEGQRKVATVLKDRPLTNLVIDPNSMLMEAARRLDEWQVIESRISSGNEVPVPAEDMPEAPEDELLKIVLGVADGTSTADEIVEKTKLSKFEAHSTLYQLLEGGWLRLATSEELTKLARACRRKHQPEKCIKLYEAAIQQQPQDADLRNSFAKLCEELDDKSRAVTQYEWLAKQEINATRIDESIPLLTRIKELEPENLFAREGLFQAALRLNQIEPATQEGQFLIDNYRHSRELEKAKLVAERLLGFNPRSPTRLRALVDILLEKGETTEAIRQCEQLAGIFDRQGKKQELERIYEQILALDRSRHDIRERLRHIGRRAAARRKKMLILGGSLAAAVVIAGVVSLVVINRSKLAKAYRETAKQAEVLVAEGSLAKAIDLYHQFIKEHAGSSWAEKAAEEAKELESRYAREQAELEVRITELSEEAAEFEDKRQYQDALKLYQELATLVAADKKNAIETKIKQLEQMIAKIDRLHAQAQQLEKNGNYQAARKAYMQLVADHPWSLGHIKVELPVEVVSLPAGAALSIDGKSQGVTPALVHYPPLKDLTLKIAKAGCREQTIKLNDDPDWRPGVIVLPKLAKWEFTTGGIIEASPVVAGNKVIIGSRDGKVYALEVASGRLLWDFKGPKFEAFISAPVVGNDKVYVTTNTEGSIIAIQLDTGEKIWQFDTKQMMRSSPCITPEGLICVGSFDKHLYALAETQTGAVEVRWKFPTAGSIQSTPRYFDGKLYFGSDDGNVYCVSTDQGTKIWEFPTGAEVRSSPWVEGGTVYVGSDDGHLYALDANNNGQPLWKFRTGGKVRSSAIVCQGQVLVGSTDGKLYRIDPGNGREVWSYDTGKPITASPSCEEGKVYFGSNDGSLYALRFETGELIWQGNTGGPINCSPTPADGLVIVGSEDRKAYAFPTD